MLSLFDPFRIKNLELRNRFVRSATWDNTADRSGAVSDKSVPIYRKLAQGRVGLIVTGFAYVAPSGQALPRQYGAHSDAMLPGIRRLAEAAHHGGAKIALQIVHAGINSSYMRETGSTARVVSKIADPLKLRMLPLLSHSSEKRIRQRELTGEEITKMVDDFAAAALRGKKAGFDAVEIHAAHGYLLSQFLSPLFNLRADEWGGSAEKRRRIHLEIALSVRRAVGPDFPVLLKLGVMDDIPGGLSLVDGLETARCLVEQGVDAVEVSGGMGRPQAPRVSLEFVPYRERAARLKREIGVPVILVGGIRSLEMCREIVEGGKADLIAMCRPLIREPDLIARWERKEYAPSTCVSCMRCHSIDDEPVQCRKQAGNPAYNRHGGPELDSGSVAKC
jgi:2,4-dienoyl-CoA reductase-like NADH-dependent reductase (Old Yellow Enzyme family)